MQIEANCTKGTQVNEDDLALGMVNRAVLVVRPGEPFIHWAAKVTGASVDETREDLSHDQTAYLIPEADSAEIEPEVLEALYPAIFERELMSWWTDRRNWPAPRTLAMFREWFTLELCSMAIDLCEEPIDREEG